MKNYDFNHDNSKFSLLLQKGGYPYEYMDAWEKFNEISLPGKEVFLILLERPYPSFYMFSGSECTHLTNSSHHSSP